MTTVADIALKVAREVTDVVDGVATAGATTSLTDTNTLIQSNQYWDRGTLFIKSGTHAGKVLAITGHALNALTFSALGSAIAAGDRYSVIRGIYPWQNIMTAIMQAMDGTHVTGEDYSLTGDGETLDFTLPAGVYDIKRVLFKRDNMEWLASNHWAEINGKLRFDYGYAPVDGDKIHIFYKGQHADLSLYSDEISNEINVEWLKYKAAEQLLWWGVSMYGSLQEYRIEERMNKVMNALKNKRPRYDGPDIIVHTAGVYK